jgi:hypothetical protein
VRRREPSRQLQVMDCLQVVYFRKV